MFIIPSEFKSAAHSSEPEISGELITIFTKLKMEDFIQIELTIQQL